MTGKRMSYKEVHIEGRWRAPNAVQDNDDSEEQRKIYGICCFRAKKLKKIL